MDLDGQRDWLRELLKSDPEDPELQHGEASDSMQLSHSWLAICDKQHLPVYKAHRSSFIFPLRLWWPTSILHCKLSNSLQACTCWRQMHGRETALSAQIMTHKEVQSRTAVSRVCQSRNSKVLHFQMVPVKTRKSPAASFRCSIQPVQRPSKLQRLPRTSLGKMPVYATLLSMPNS